MQRMRKGLQRHRIHSTYEDVQQLFCQTAGKYGATYAKSATGSQGVKNKKSPRGETRGKKEKTRKK